VWCLDDLSVTLCPLLCIFGSFWRQLVYPLVGVVFVWKSGNVVFFPSLSFLWRPYNLDLRWVVMNLGSFLRVI